MGLPVLDRSPAGPGPDPTGPGADGPLDAGATARRPRRSRIAAASAIALVALAVGLALLVQSSSTPRKTAGSAIPPGDTTTTVARRTLTESAQVDGTLGYGGALEIYDR